MHNFLTKISEYLNFLKGGYSQEGEDAALAGYLKDRKKGFFVDVGAHHPTRFSNTYLFYKKGWRGINIDATPGSMKLFRKYRPRDINIEIPISNTSKEVDYYMFDEPALNSFSTELSKDRDSNTKYKIKKTVKLIPNKLSEVLNRYLPQNIKIDFMSIDVEGYEYEVLSSNDWKKYRPDYLLVEVLRYDSVNAESERILSFLKSKNYSVVKKIGRNIIFRDNRRYIKNEK